MDQRLFGLIGQKLEHSFSMDHFAEKFRKEGIEDARYEAFPLEAISEFPKLLEKQPALIGLNVTIPYKEAIIPYLDELSETALAIGAVNTVRLSNGKREGFNTDAEGFETDIRPLLPRERGLALVLGTGGASRAISHVLEKLGFELLFISRKGTGERTLSYEALTPEQVSDAVLIANTTPLGTWPDTQEAPHIPYEGIRSGTLLYDLIYNPPTTRFLKKGEEQGAKVRNGKGMLVGQAEAAWRIWNEA